MPGVSQFLEIPSGVSVPHLPPLGVAPLRRFLDRCGVLTNGGRANAEMDCVG
jgi:hypothetical protein